MHESTASALCNLGILYLVLERPKDFIVLLERALTIQETTDPLHPDAAMWKINQVDEITELIVGEEHHGNG